LKRELFWAGKPFKRGCRSRSRACGPGLDRRPARANEAGASPNSFASLPEAAYLARRSHGAGAREGGGTDSLHVTCDAFLPIGGSLGESSVTRREGILDPRSILNGPHVKLPENTRIEDCASKLPVSCPRIGQRVRDVGCYATLSVAIRLPTPAKCSGRAKGTDYWIAYCRSTTKRPME